MGSTANRTQNKLVLCRASAGTGKTTSICDVIVEHIVQRDLDPAQILATTFTLRAAAELEERIHARLMSETSITPDKRAKLAERLELARIGTIDAVAFQIVERYAIDLGLSPDVRVADEVTSRRTLERLVSEVDSDEWEALHHAADPLGIEKLDDVILELLELQRANGITPADARTQLLASADRMIEILAPEGAAAGLENAPDLRHLAREIHDQIQELGDTTKVTAKALSQLRRLTSTSTPRWADLMRVSKLSAGKKSGADKALAPLRAAVGVVRRHPLLHRDLREFLTRCADVTEKLGDRYQRTKAERGLVDFRDLELEMLKLLANPVTAEQIASEVRLFVVDEFQDTDPLQLALFLELQRLVPESYWVGDEKQAIYGFRGTDARLTRAVWESAEPGAPSDWAHAPELRTLDTSYRSLPRLVDTVGELFADSLGPTVVVKCGRGRPDEANAGDPAATGALERWELHTSRRDEELELIADGVVEMLADQPPADDTSMAILVRSHHEARTVGRALGDRGVPSVLELPGVTRTRTSVAALAALQLLADPWDSAAAATLIHHVDEDADESAQSETPAWLESRLREVQSTESGAPFAGHPLVDAIDRLRERIRTHSPAEALTEVVEAIDLPAKLATWGHATRRASDLDALHQLAAEYEEHQHDAGEAISIPGLIRHLERLRREDKDAVVPPLTRGAVHVVTYHAAKGLQWSTVILGSLDWEGSTNLWRPEVIGAVRITGGSPLAHRQLRYWPWPFGTSSRSKYQRASADGFEKEALDTPEGRAAVREQQDESIRLLYVGATRARDRLILTHRPDRHRWLDRLRHADDVLGRHVTEVRQLHPRSATTAGDRATTEITFAPLPRDRAIAVEAWHSPSRAEATPDGPKITVERVPLDDSTPDATGESEPSDLPPSALREERDRVGNALHAYFATLPASDTLIDADRRVAAERCLLAHLDPARAEAEGLTPDQLVRWGEKLRRWIDATYPNARWYTETPISGVRSEGGHWVGLADLLLETEDGRTVVIDHKSAAVSASGAESVARHYAPQLDAYRAAVSGGDDSTTIETWLHLPRAGCMVHLGETGPSSNSTPRSWVQSELF